MIKASDVQLISFNEVSSTLITYNDINSSINLKQQRLYFNNGFNFTINSLCSGIRDVSINNDSILMLADHIPLTAVYTDANHIITEKYENLLKYSVLRVEFQKTENINKIYDKDPGVDIDTIISNNSKYLNITNNTVSLEDSKQQLFFKFNNERVSILNDKEYCLTDRDTFFISAKFSDLDNQKFYYIINNKNLFLFKDKARRNVIVFDCIQNNITSQLLEGGAGLNTKNTLFVELFKDLNLKSNSIQNSFLLKYKNNPISAKNSTDIDDILSLPKYNCQYLINIPYKNTENNIYINSLKNYQTPEYEHAIRTNKENRYYTNIFSGNNQSTGYSNIFLNYTSSTFSKTLEKDNETYFYYPATSPVDCIPLSSAGLIEDGAIAGKNPYTSDRIKFNYRDYKEYNIPSLTSVITDNTWLFSWLSAGDSKSQWVDRFYIGDADIRVGPDLEGDIKKEKALIFEPVPPGVGELAQPGTFYNFNTVGTFIYRITVLPGDTVSCFFDIGFIPDKISILDSNLRQIATTGWIGSSSYQNQLPEPLTSNNLSATIAVKNQSKNIPYMYIKVEQVIEGSSSSMKFDIIPGPRPELPPPPPSVVRTKPVSGWMVDMPSTMCLSPGRLYSYFHQGFNNINKYIKTFNQIHRDGTTNLLYVNKWDNVNIQDLSIHKNDGIHVLGTKKLSTDQIHLTGKNYVLFPSTDNLKEDKQLTIGAWIKVDNWSKISGYQIFGNYADGGIGLYNKQIIHTTLFTIYDKHNSYIYNYNTNVNLISEQNVSYNSQDTVYIQRLMNQQYWLINTTSFILTKYDLNNNKILELDVSRYVSSISQIETDEDENLYIVDNIVKKIHKINNKTGDMMFGRFGIELPARFTRIEILNKQNHRDLIFIDGKMSIIGVTGDQSTADSQNNIWYTLGSNLYKNKEFYACIGIVNRVVCDSLDNIWILHNFNKITKINTYNNLFEFTLTLSNSSSQDIYINFIHTNISGENQDLLLAVNKQEGTVYTINAKGEIINKINLYLIPSVFSSKQDYINTAAYTALGDFTGYEYQRRFNKHPAVEWRISCIDRKEENGKDLETVFKLTIPTLNFDEGWHYFNLVFDHKQGQIISYIDGEIVNQVLFEQFKYIIKSSSKPYCIGAITTIQGILNDSIGVNDLYKFIGYISNIHIYKYSFDKHDIKNLYYGTYIDMFKNLTWNINIGNRNYIEEIERFFMNKMPGSKSKFFNVKIHNFAATEDQRIIIENAIYRAVKRIAPADTVLNKILWV